MTSTREENTADLLFEEPQPRWIVEWRTSANALTETWQASDNAPCNRATALTRRRTLENSFKYAGVPTTVRIRLIDEEDEIV